LPELRVLPPGLQLDGEIYAPGEDGAPDFHRLAARLLRGERGIAVVYAVFDLLAVDDTPTLDMPYRDRHALLAEFELPTDCTVIESFADPEVLWEAVLELRLEGIVAKRERDRHRSGEKLWIRRKRWPRRDEERELAMPKRTMAA
jgi:bifunctional non-homologous end joining protein LigD